MVSHSAFAMGDAPSTCTNRYDGQITSFVINNGTQTFDAIANPGVTFDVKRFSDYNVTFTIHTSNESSLKNTDPGTTWYRDDAFAFGNGHCVPNRTTASIGPSQDVTVNRILDSGCTGCSGTQSVDFNTFVNGVSYNVHWLSVPEAPTNLSATGFTSTQIQLDWSAAYSYVSPVTSYKIYRSTASGNETLLATVGNVLTYNDAGLSSGTTYYYRISAVNSYGEGPQSGEARSAPTPPGQSYVIVKTAEPDNSQIYGYKAVLSQSGSTVAIGYSTKAFTVDNSKPYDLTIDDIDSFVFDHWQDNNSTTRDKAISTDHTIWLTAVFKNSNSQLPSVQVGSGARYAAVNPHTNRIYVTNLLGNTVSVIDGENNTVVATVGVNSPQGVAVNPATNKVYVSNSPGNTVTVLDGASNSVLSAINVGTNPWGIAVNPATNMIYVANQLSASVSVIDGASNTMITSIHVGGTGPSSIAVNPVTDKIYADGGGEISVINGATNTVAGTIHVGGGLFGIGIDPNANLIYVADGNNHAYVIDGSTNAIINTISIPYAAGGVTVNPNTGLAYVTSNDQVIVLGGDTHSAIFTLGAGCCPMGADVNIATNRIYLAEYNNGPSYTTVYDGSGPATTGQGTSGITLGNIQSTSGTTDSSNQMTLSNFNAGEGTNNLLVVGISANSNNVASVTFSGTQMTRAVSSFYNNDAEFWYLKNPPGTGDITVTMNGPTQAVIGAYSFSGVNQAVPIPTHVARHNTTPNSPSISVTTKYPNDVVLDLPSIYGGEILSGSTCTSEWDVNVPNKITGASSLTTVQTSSAATCGWTASSADLWDDVAIEIQASGTSPSAATATVPGAPSNLAATAISSSQIDLSWAAPQDNGGSSIIGYQMQRSSDNGTTWSTVQSNTGSASTTYSDIGLAASTSYTYQVSAINAVGTGSQSNTASATTQPGISFGYSNSTAILLNNVQSTSGTTDSSNQITLSRFNATVGSGRLLVVGVSANNNNVGSITFAGVALARAVSHFTNNDAEFWYLANPAGTGDITVTMNGPTQAVVGAYSFSGVNQTAPIPAHITRHNLTPSSPSISITTMHPNDLVLDLPSIWGGVTLGSPTCAQHWDLNVAGQITGSSSSAMVPTPANVTCSWAASSGNMWDDAAIELRAAG